MKKVGQIIKRTMMGGLVLGAMTFGGAAQAAGGESIYLEAAKVDVSDIDSIKRGGQYFAQQCLVCHALKYLKHNDLVKEAGITYDKMPKEDQEWWFGTPPPDLSLSARERSADWLYTYLHSFYQDPSRNIGSNNLLVHNINMPNPFVGLQGEQELIVDRDTLSSGHGKPMRYFEAVKLMKQGSMSPNDFDDMTHDLVNFLVYVSDPSAHVRHKMGWWVIGFLFLFLFILAIPLKRAFWKGLKK